MHLLVDRHHGREAAGADAGDALHGELAGGIGVLVAGQAEAPSQFRSDQGGPGHVAGRAFADADDVLADGALAELPVERGDARDLRRRHLARAGHLPQRLVRQEAVARLDGLEHRDDGLRLSALRLEDPVHGAEVERRALARRHERQDRRLELPSSVVARPVPGAPHPHAGRGPQPARPREEQGQRHEQQRPDALVEAESARQRLTLPVEFRLQQGRVDRGVGLRPLLQGLDERLLRRLGARGAPVLDREPCRRHDDDHGGGGAEPRAQRREPPRRHAPDPGASPSRGGFCACHSRKATGSTPPRRSISRGQVS